MDNKGIIVGIIVTVICIQAVHLASVSKSLDYLHLLDDSLGLSYTAWNSSTTAYSYQLGFTVVVAGATVIIYAILLVVKLAGMNLSAKVQEILYGLVAVLQFALAVLLGITQSRQIDPNGPNGSTVSASSVYTTFFNTQLADTVLIWVLCVPGSYILAHLHSQPSSEPAKAQTTEMAMRN